MSEAVGSSEGDGEEAGAISAEGGVWGAAGSAICEANPIPNELVERCLANAEERALQEWNYDARHGLSKKQIVALREPSIVLKEAQDSSKLERHACAFEVMREGLLTQIVTVIQLLRCTVVLAESRTVGKFMRATLRLKENETVVDMFRGKLA